MDNLKPEQLKAINHEQGNILISASAGSGKTFVMTKRLIRLICEKKASVNQILAMTFTESAAEEMKIRVKTALKDEAINDLNLTQEIAMVNYADICTIHSFCAKIIRTYFYKVGILPDFKIGDEGEAEILKSQAIRKTFDDFYQQEDQRFLTILDYYSSRNDEIFAKLILSIYDFIIAESQPENMLNISLFYQSEEGFNKICDLMLNNYKKEIEIIIKKLQNLSDQSAFCFPKYVDYLEQIIQSLSQSLSEKDVYELIKYKNIDFGTMPKNSSGDESSIIIKEKIQKLKQKIRDFFEKIGTHFSDRESDLLRAKANYQQTQDLFYIVNAFKDNYTKIKRENNILDFSDLEIIAKEILSDAEVGKEVQEKYKYIFVDEYQDVNPIQEEIIKSISNGNLFMVGDEKQSIYGFRGCRPEIFRDKFNAMKNNGEATVELNYNFRSAQKILDAVNTVFCYSMTEDIYGLNYKETSFLKTGGIYSDSECGRAELDFIQEKDLSKEREKGVYDIIKEAKGIKEEKSNIAGLIAKIIDDETKKIYYNPKLGREAHITRKDIAILTRNKTDYAESLVKGLIDRGISVESKVKVSVLDYPEVKGLEGLLRLLDNFNDSISILKVMKSPIGDFTDLELAEIAFYYKDNAPENKEASFLDFYYYYLENAKTDLCKKLIVFNTYIQELSKFATCVSCREVLDKVVSDMDIYACLLAQVGGEEKAERVRFFLDVADKKSYTIKEFLDVINSSSSVFDYSTSNDQDAVSVMTIHASKGLEFPVVILCGIERSFNNEDQRNKVLLSRSDGIAVQYFDQENRVYYETPYRAYLKSVLKTNIIKEEERLFYVGMTRASYSLYLVAEGEDQRDNVFLEADSFEQYIPSMLAKKEVSESEIYTANMTADKRNVIITKKDQDAIDKLKQRFDYSYPYLCDTTLPLKSTVTEINEQNKIKTYNVVDDDLTNADKKGIIAHKIMQYFDFESGESLFNQVDKMIINGITTKQEVEQVDLNKIQEAIKGFNEFACGKTLFREKSFLISIPAKEIIKTQSEKKVLLQGVIDLLVIGKEGASIIDYKYSSLYGSKLMEKYKTQLSLYAYAVEKGLNIKVVSKKLLNIKTGEIIEL